MESAVFFGFTNTKPSNSWRMDQHGLFHKMFLISNTNKTSYTRMWAHLKDNWQSLSLSWQKASRNVPGTYLMHFSIWIHQCFYTCNAASECNAKEQRKLMNDRKNEWINEMMSGWKMKPWISASLLFFWMNDWINEELNGIMNEWTNEWMTDWMIEWTSVHDEKIAPVP